MPGVRSAAASAWSGGRALSSPLRSAAVGIDALAGLAAQPPVGDHRGDGLTRAGVGRHRARQARGEVARDVAAHVDAHLVHEPQRTHRHAEVEHDPVDPRGVVAFLEVQPQRLGHVRQQDAVDEEAGRILDDHRQLADGFDVTQRGVHRRRVRARATDDLHELHAVDGVEEMDAHHAAGVREAVGDAVDGKGGGVRGEHGFRRDLLFERGENFLLEIEFFDGGLDDEIDPAQGHVARHGHHAVEARLGVGLGEDAALGGVAEQLCRWTGCPWKARRR